MSRRLPFSSLLLFIFWMHHAELPVQGLKTSMVVKDVGNHVTTCNEETLGKEREMEESASPNFGKHIGWHRPIFGQSFHCHDIACNTIGGVCQFFWSSPCYYRSYWRCAGFFCACCVPCKGCCGFGGNSGRCRSYCQSDEYKISGNCGQFGCSCCAKIPDCTGRCGFGYQGTCKQSCDPSTEYQVSALFRCSKGCRCCKTKPVCNQSCGKKNKHICRAKVDCPFWRWRHGSCPSGCRCCKK